MSAQPAARSLTAESFRPSTDNNRFIWAIQGMHPNASVKAGNVTDNAGHLAHLWQELLDYAAKVEAERDRWEAVATKLAGLDT